MIPTIGVMVGAVGIVVCLYVVVRCGEIARREGVGGGMQFLAVLTIVVCLFAIAVTALMTWSLILSGTSEL